MKRRGDLDAIPGEIRRGACAFHEAGHIVVGWHHRRYITHAWLRPPHGFSGETCFEPYQRTFRRERSDDIRRAEAEVTILQAGYCGEMIFWNEGKALEWYPGGIQSHADDLQQMLPYIGFVAPADEPAFRARCANAATAILYRPSVLAAQKRIAGVLLDRWRIEPGEVDAILTAATSA